ncbi:flagellar hook-basal body protein [Cohnella pontilimi]|uniref:Flagellar hook-basal body protein n=1 Tax=Cohnella pontilimi TaxID=2564100 RepID=A0A4U0FB56_9BACL|nr:flagellar hook-basal body protein [Cohnella pontilimi]TJY41917.1 flagellar hook-basal body protein [Cohnella pontilimi]
MLRGLYTAAGGMMAQQRRHDTVTNNIANLNTPGFKANNAINRSFPDMLIAAVGGENTREGRVGTLSTGVFAEENMLSMGQGDIRQTFRPQDMALISDLELRTPIPGAVLDGSGKYIDATTGLPVTDANGNAIFQPQAFFTVNTPQGERYTRDGSFQTAADGTLLTAGGSEVLDVNGQRIVINGSWDDIAVTSDGSLIDKTTGQALPNNPRLRLTRVENPNDLIREGNGLFRYDGAQGGIGLLQAGDRAEVRQGFLERSNVDAAQSAVDLMAALRAYEANQKVIQFYDRSLDKAVNEIGKV